MKNNSNTHSQLCSETNSMLLQYGFAEEYYTIVKEDKKEKQRFLYLQPKPTVGLLVYNFCHSIKKGNFQGFDMFMYSSDNVKDAIYQFNRHDKNRHIPKAGLLCFQDKIEQTRFIVEQLLEDGSEDYSTIVSKFNQLVMETYKMNTNPIDDYKLLNID